MKNFLKIIAVVTFISLQTASCDLSATPEKKAQAKHSKKDKSYKKSKKNKKEKTNKKPISGSLRVSNINSIVNSSSETI